MAYVLLHFICYIFLLMRVKIMLKIDEINIMKEKKIDFITFMYVWYGEV